MGLRNFCSNATLRQSLYLPRKSNGILSDPPLQINSVLDMFQCWTPYSPQNPHMAWMPCAMLVLPRTSGPCCVGIFPLSWMLTLSHIAFIIKHQIHVISLLPNIFCSALVIPLGKVIFTDGYRDALNGCFSGISLLLSHSLENNTSCLSQFHPQINKSSSQDFVTC